MAIQLKKLDEIVTEELVQNLIGKTVHAPTNKHIVKQQIEGKNAEVKVNAWFAGVVAGYEKAFINYDFETGRFLTEPKTYYNILLTDGMGYQLAIEESEIIELNDEEWAELIAEFNANENVKDLAQEIIMPEQPRIILPGE